jgi:hypothetical protein
MTTLNASASGRFSVGDIDVNRLGFGAMRITGPGIWGANRPMTIRSPFIGTNSVYRRRRVISHISSKSEQNF